MNSRKTTSIKLIALGGVGELGKNMYVVEVNEDIFVIDAGLMYPEDEMLGIDVVIPDISYLRENKQRVKGIFITHGHEDHIGALPYIISELTVPIYGTKLSIELIKAKLHAKKVTAKVDFRQINATSKLSFTHAEMTFFRTTHSIPDSIGVCIHTSEGAIVHTGDFKFDQAATPFYRSELGKMEQIGDDGVLCLLSDSTEAERRGYSTSEAVVFEKTCQVLADAPGRVIVACFASDINRIQHLLQAAKKSGRKVAVVGEALQRNYDIALKLGYLQVDTDLLIPIQQIHKYAENEVVILTTGNQGEPIEALQKMARNMHNQVNIHPGDSVLFAASPIKGSEIQLSRTIDLIYRAGVSVISLPRSVHISSHGSAEELKLMLNLMRPKFFIPVHGEERMLKAHANIAVTRGLTEEHIFIPENGDVLEYKNGNMGFAGRVTAGNVLIDGYGIGDVGNIVLRDRRLLSQDGILISVVTLDRGKKQIISGPEIISRGFVYVRESEKLIEESTRIVREIVEKNMKAGNFDWNILKQEMRDELSYYLFQKTRRRPMILPILMEI